MSGHVDKAIAALLPLLPSTGTEMPLLHAALAAALERSGRLAEAARALRGCINVQAKEGGGKGVSSGVCFERLARVLNRQGRLEEALEVLDEAGAVQDAGIHAMRASLLMKRGDSQGALQEALRGSQLRPDDAGVWLLCGDAARGLGRLQDAASFIGEGVAHVSDPGARASLFAALGDLEAGRLWERVGAEGEGKGAGGEEISRASSILEVALCQDRCEWVGDGAFRSGAVVSLSGEARRAVVAYRQARRAMRECMAQEGHGSCHGWLGGGGESGIAAAEARLWGQVGHWSISLSLLERIIEGKDGAATTYIIAKCQVRA
jgi:tetratricopeptide (TPR) repeat protein